MTDIHSHILYGLDDGSPDLRTSKKMLSAARAAGVDRIIATPHVRTLPFDFSAAYQTFDVVREAAQQQGIQLELGFEVHWNALLTFDEQSYRKLCFENTRNILIEFSLSADALPDGHTRMIYRLQRSGLNVIIAHPERYRFVQDDRSMADFWHDMGCSLQLDAICLLRGYERKSKPTARKLFKADAYDYIASDAHCPEDYALFAKAMEWVERRG